MAQSDAMKWVWRGVTWLTLLAGWLFILVQNKFHIDPPVVVVMLAYLAVVLTVTNLWRVGASAVGSEDTSDDAWDRPVGERGELEREKKTLLRSIKEAEFDLAMNKLSKVDAEELIAMYRVRAIEVIKELDRIDAGGAATTRDKIKREVAARLVIASKVEATEKKSKKQARKAEPVAEPEPAPAVDDDKPAATAEEAS